MNTQTNGATPQSWAAVSDITRRQELLGAVVTWRLNGLQVSEQDLDLALQSEGLQAYKPSVPSPRLALRRAIEAAVRQNRVERTYKGPQPPTNALGAALVDADGTQPTRELIRPIREPGDWHVYALVSEHADIQELSLKHATRVRFRVHKQTGTLFVTNTATGDIDAQTETAALAQQITTFYNFFRETYTSRDISALLKHIVGDGGSILLRPEGGAYFVPHSYLPTLEATERLVDRLAKRHGGAAFFLLLGVPDEDREKKRMARAAHQALSDQIETLAIELDKLALVPDDKALKRHMAQYPVVRTQIEAYIDLLGLRQDDLVQRLQRLAGSAAAALIGPTS
jgi:hypothetical protein